MTFSLSHYARSGSEAHLASGAVRTGGLFHGVKRPGREANHSHPSFVEAKIMWSYIFTPPYISMVWCLIEEQICFHGMVVSKV